MRTQKLFLSYSRINAEFALNLAVKLKKEGANLWIDQLDIPAGSRWDQEVGKALDNAECLLVVLSSKSVSSNNVLDEVSYALDTNKRVIPVLIDECSLPFRLRRLQHINFIHDFDAAFSKLVKALNDETDQKPETIVDKPEATTAPTADPEAPLIEPEDKHVYKEKGTFTTNPPPTIIAGKNSGRNIGIILSAVVILAVLAVVFLKQSSADKKQEQTPGNGITGTANTVPASNDSGVNAVQPDAKKQDTEPDARKTDNEAKFKEQDAEPNVRKTDTEPDPKKPPAKVDYTNYHIKLVKQDTEPVATKQPAKVDLSKYHLELTQKQSDTKPARKNPYGMVQNQDITKQGNVLVPSNLLLNITSGKFVFHTGDDARERGDVIISIWQQGIRIWSKKVAATSAWAVNTDCRFEENIRAVIKPKIPIITKLAFCNPGGTDLSWSGNVFFTLKKSDNYTNMYRSSFKLNTAEGSGVPKCTEVEIKPITALVN